MNVLVTIEGRETIPVRALPWLTDWEFSADAVAEALAHDEGFEHFRDVRAWRLKEGKPAAVPVRLWRNEVTIALEDLAARGLPRHEWQAEATRTLPAGVFVWRDEWEGAYNRSPDGPGAFEETAKRLRSEVKDARRRAKRLRSEAKDARRRAKGEVERLDEYDLRDSGRRLVLVQRALGLRGGGQWWLTANNPDGSRATQMQPVDDSKIVGRVVLRQSEAL